MYWFSLAKIHLSIIVEIKSSCCSNCTLDEKSLNPHGKFKRNVRKVTHNHNDDLSFHFGPDLLWLKGVSLLGLLRSSNEAQGDVKNSLSKIGFGFKNKVMIRSKD